MEGPRSLGEAIRECNKVVNELIALLRKKTKREADLADIDTLRRRVNLLRNHAGEDSLLKEATPHITSRSEEIMDRSRYEQFILTCDVRKEYLRTHKAVAPEDEFIFKLIEQVRAHYKIASQQEKDDVYCKVCRLHTCCLEYQYHSVRSQMGPL